MTFSAYVQRQKRIIRSRHEGEVYLTRNGEIVKLSESEKIFKELSAMKGLNTEERLKAYASV